MHSFPACTALVWWISRPRGERTSEHSCCTYLAHTRIIVPQSDFNSVTWQTQTLVCQTSSHTSIVYSHITDIYYLNVCSTILLFRVQTEVYSYSLGPQFLYCILVILWSILIFEASICFYLNAATNHTFKELIELASQKIAYVS